MTHLEERLYKIFSESNTSEVIFNILHVILSVIIKRL